MKHISPIQAEINRRLGISSETFLKYSTEPESKKQTTPSRGTLTALALLDPVKQAINRQLGVSDEVFLKYATRS
jgi:hypothetical protein